MKRVKRLPGETHGDAFVDYGILRSSGSLTQAGPKVRKEPKTGRRKTSWKKRPLNNHLATSLAGPRAVDPSKPYFYGQSSYKTRSKISQAYEAYLESLPPHERAAVIRSEEF